MAIIIVKYITERVSAMYYIACFGDSLIEGFPFGSDYSWIRQLESSGEITAYNYGLCGDCTDDIFDRMRYRPLPEQVKHILYLGGANDIIQGVPERFTVANVAKVVNWCEEKGYKLCLVLPFVSGDEVLNRKLLNLRQEYEHHFKDKAFILDLQPAIGTTAALRKKAYLDTVHPTLATYKAMGEYSLPILLQWVKS